MNRVGDARKGRNAGRTRLDTGHRGPSPSAVSSASIELLVTALASRDVRTRQRAREGLVAVGRPAIGPLIDAMTDRRSVVRWEAAKALSAIADPSAAAAMLTALEDEDAGIRWLAAEGLIALQRDGVGPLLRALIANSDSEWFREGTHHILHGIIRRKWAKPLARVLVALEGPAPHLAAPLAAQEALDAMGQAR
jgi:hypothetical protein